MVSPFSDFYVNAYTFSDDTAHRIENNHKIVLSAGNVHCYLFDAYYGNAYSAGDAIIRANAVIWFDAPFRPYDLLFKNLVAGSNAKIVITGPIKEKGE